MSGGRTHSITSNFMADMHLLLPPQGFWPEGETPRGHSSNSRVLRKVLTVEIYSHTVKYRKYLDFLEQGPRGIGR